MAGEAAQAVEAVEAVPVAHATEAEAAMEAVEAEAAKAEARVLAARKAEVTAEEAARSEERARCTSAQLKALDVASVTGGCRSALGGHEGHAPRPCPRLLRSPPPLPSCGERC